MIWRAATGGGCVASSGGTRLNRFDDGLLELVRIAWNVPAVLLAKFMNCEAACAIQSWADLTVRLMPGRRTCAFVQPDMRRELLIFVGGAMVEDMVDNIQGLLAADISLIDEINANTAIFCFIPEAEFELDGGTLDAFHFKQVVEDIGHDIPGLMTFASRGPMPVFWAWLEEALADESDQLQREEVAALAKTGGSTDPERALEERLAYASWPDDKMASKAQRPIPTRPYVSYLKTGRQRSSARNPVAHFHRGTGARVERINWFADRSDAGMARYRDLTFYYRQELSDAEANHEAYRGRSGVQVPRTVRKLV